MNKKLFYSLLIGGAIRFFLSISNYAKSIENKNEISTPLNSFKRILEGSFLYDSGVDPYEGDMYHENPLVLVATNFIINHLNEFIPLLFILIDLLTAVLLYYATKNFTKRNYEKEQKEKSKFAQDTEEIQMQEGDLLEIPFNCALAYIFLPYSILNCVGKTSTVFSNFFLAATLFSISKDYQFLCLLALALETQKNFYPFILIVPVMLAFSQNTKSKTNARVLTLTMFLGILGALQYVSYCLMGNWKFLDATYGFIIHYRDLQPNIGLFWYFFIEMFEQFRQLFLYTFQLNATILYLFPLTFALKDCPEFLLTILLSLTAIFRSYPCIGDVAFYMALIPMWKRVSNFMSHNFIVVATFIVTTVLAPTVWHLWIYSNSANANFFFGVTLVFSTAQIFLVTDLTFAFLKRQFCLEHGTTFKIDGKEARLTLE